MKINLNSMNSNLIFVIFCLSSQSNRVGPICVSTCVTDSVLRYDLTDIARIAFMFNGGQSPASVLSLHSNRLNRETYREPCSLAPHLYLLSHTFN